MRRLGVKMFPASAAASALQFEAQKRMLLTEQKQRVNRACMKCGKAITEEEFDANQGFCAKCLALIQESQTLAQEQKTTRKTKYKTKPH